MLDLKNKVAVITGASYGIGRAVAIKLAREGCQVILVARSKEGLEKTQKQIINDGGKAVVVPTDIAKLEDINDLCDILQKDYGHVDVLWNGAFGWIDGPLEKNDDDKLVDFIDSSIRGVLVLTKKVMPFLLKSETPHIINVVADWEFPEMDGVTAFIAAKRALAGMGIALQKEKMGKVKITNLHPADVASSDDYSVDDDVSTVSKKTENGMISLKEISDIVIFILKLEGTVVHQIDIKPLKQEIGMTFL